LWLLIGNILKHNICTEINKGYKIWIYIANLVTISIIIIIVNYIGSASGYSPVYENNFIFSSFIGLRNDWFGSIYFIIINFLYTGNLIDEQIIGVAYFLSTVFIILGVICGFNTRQIIRRSVRKSNS
jgi:hypothetical protein